MQMTDRVKRLKQKQKEKRDRAGNGSRGSGRAGPLETERPETETESETEEDKTEDATPEGELPVLEKQTRLQKKLRWKIFFRIRNFRPGVNLWH